MKKLSLTLLLFTFWGSCLFGQCHPIALPDSSFELGTLTDAGTFVPGFWYTDDGCDVFGFPYSGDSSACSNGGGAFQKVIVDSNTTYYLSCFVNGGATDPYPSLKVNWIPHVITPTSNNWSLVATSFNTGSDTVAFIGFYSGGACFDHFRLTCSLPTELEDGPEPEVPFKIRTVFAQSRYFTIQFAHKSELTVMDLNGRVIDQFASPQFEIEFGESYPSGVYILNIRDGDLVRTGKVIKF